MVVYSKLKENYNGETTLTCEILWEEAKKTSLHTVGSTVKSTDIDVVHCQLGCFRDKKGHHESKS